MRSTRRSKDQRRRTRGGRPPARARTAGRRLLGAGVAVGTLLLVSSAGYTVRSGDTLWDIARQHGTTVGELASLNGIADPNRIRVGQVLELPGSHTPAPETPSEATGAVLHTVQPGEHLSGIASRYGTTVSRIVEANGLADPNHVEAGRDLTVPVPDSGLAAIRHPVSREHAEGLLEATARQHGWNPAFVKAVAWQESGWQQDTVSSTGALGIMQVQPETGRFVSRELAGRDLDLTDPTDNVLAGVLFLDYLYDLTAGDARMTLAGYYQGLGSVRNRGMYPSTVRYIDNVLALKARYS